MQIAHVTKLNQGQQKNTTDAWGPRGGVSRTLISKKTFFQFFIPFIFL